MSQEQQRPKPLAPGTAPVPIQVPPVEVPPTEEVLQKIKGALAASQQEGCECTGCRGRHTSNATQQVGGRWLCDGCAAQRKIKLAVEMMEDFAP